MIGRAVWLRWWPRRTPAHRQWLRRRRHVRRHGRVWRRMRPWRPFAWRWRRRAHHRTLRRRRDHMRRQSRWRWRRRWRRHCLPSAQSPTKRRCGPCRQPCGPPWPPRAHPLEGQQPSEMLSRQPPRLPHPLPPPRPPSRLLPPPHLLRPPLLLKRLRPSGLREAPHAKHPTLRRRDPGAAPHPTRATGPLVRMARASLAPPTLRWSRPKQRPRRPGAGATVGVAGAGVAEAGAVPNPSRLKEAF
mmetsp:Transcript_6677/g.21426  ORF Transcript_6677/g.21426 Transcript_6677/m.21426 type:complete len:244 (-) Transcript_6677:611-1342(-)